MKVLADPAALDGGDVMERNEDSNMEGGRGRRREGGSSKSTERGGDNIAMVSAGG